MRPDEEDERFRRGCSRRPGDAASDAAVTPSYRELMIGRNGCCWNVGHSVNPGACDCSASLLGLAFVPLSSLLSLAAVAVPALLPASAASALVQALIRGYRRWLSRFTPPCPSTPSCSAYALDAVVRLGARDGLAVAARRVHACGPTLIRRGHRSAPAVCSIEGAPG